MSKNTLISLGGHFDSFIQRRIAEGRYKDVSEVIRAGLRLLEQEEDKILVLKNAIQKGIDSGSVLDFDSEEYLYELKKEIRS